MYVKFVIEANQGQTWRNPNNAPPKPLEYFFSGLEPPKALVKIIDILSNRGGTS